MSDWPGVEDRAAREAMLRDIAAAVTYWIERGAAYACGSEEPPDSLDDGEKAAITALRSHGLASERDALSRLLGTCLSGLAFSVLVTLDGGTTECPPLGLWTPEGQSLGIALQEEWPDFDPTTKRDLPPI
jgi:hypothetical protein